MGLYSRKQMEADLDELDQLDQEVSKLVAEGVKDGFWAIRAGARIEKQRKRLRMKLLNAGQMIQDLKHAQAEFATAETQGASDVAEDRIKAAFNKLRWNSDGVKSPKPPERAPGDWLPAKPDYILNILEVHPDVLRLSSLLGRRMVWRPGGKPIVEVYYG